MEWNERAMQISATRFSAGQVGRLTNVAGTCVSGSDPELDLVSSSGVCVALITIHVPVPVSFFLARELKGDVEKRNADHPGMSCLAT